MMSREVFVVEKERFDLKDSSIYYLQGIWPAGYEAKVSLDHQEVSAQISPIAYESVQERLEPLEEHCIRIQMKVVLPQSLEISGTLKIYAVSGNSSYLWYSDTGKKLEARQGKPQYCVEQMQVDTKENTCRVRGWCAHSTPVQVYLKDSSGGKLPCTVQRMKRVDVQNHYPEVELEEKCGFFCEFQFGKRKKVSLVFEGDTSVISHTIPLDPVTLTAQKASTYIEKGSRYLKLHGPTALAKKVYHKFVNQREISYDRWIVKHLPSKEELERQRGTKFGWNPRFSVVVPLYKTPEPFLRALVASLQGQTYENWELCLSDGSGANSPMEEVLRKLEKEEKRIRVARPNRQLQISENTNQAIELATGDFIVFADHDDVLTPNALFECAKACNANEKLEILYTDEDKMSMDGHKFFQPHFKPDFNLDLLCTVNYICHLFVAKRELVEQVGMLRKEYDGAQDYDFVFRCVEQAGPDKIHHIPKILYHWRSHEDSTAENPESKLYAFEAGKRAVQAHYQRVGIEAQVIHGEFLGLYRTKFIRNEDPLISILIPNKDHIEDLKRCIESIDQKSTYGNYEYIIIENNSELEETFEYYKKLEAENPRVRVVYWKDVFNYSAINNFGATFAKGEYLLLLNNDTEMINEDCLEELLGYCMRPDVGAVGARLYYEDDTIQHAGVVVGFGGIAGHCFVQQPRGNTGYFHRIICAQNYSAVTAACMMVKKSAFDQVGGLCEDLKVAFNDIDFCMKLGQAGYYIVYNPYAELYHYESKSRGLEDTPEKVARFNNEIAMFEKRWPDILKNGDPYYNPNLSLETQDFSLKRI